MNVTREFVARPWGGFEVLTEGNGYKVKSLTIAPGHRFSLQKHRNRSEYWHILRGSGKGNRDGVAYDLRAGDDFYVPAHSSHRLENNGQSEMIVLEVQRGEWLEESDIERIEDDYGRK